jgi:hypothetical protein
MKAILSSFLSLLMWATPQTAETQEAMEIELKDLDELLARYRDYALPLPPDDAKLVRFLYGSSTEPYTGVSTPLYALGFWLNHDARQETPEILVGPIMRARARDGENNIPEILNPDLVSMDGVEMKWIHKDRDLWNPDLAVMIQCHARGYKKLTQQLAKRSLNAPSRGRGPSAVSSGGPWVNPREKKTAAAPHGGEHPRRMLAGLAWNYWQRELIQENSNWIEVLGRMKHILEAEPSMENENRKALLRSIEKSLTPSKSKPGSIEARIDELVHATQPDGGLMPSPSGDPVERIEMLGFSAVPVLIDHCDDDRLTRSVTEGFNNFPTLHRRVGEIVSDILQTISGEDLGADWLLRQTGYGVQKEAAKEWWA